jgi:hypothetical protein
MASGSMAQMFPASRHKDDRRRVRYGRHEAFDYIGSFSAEGQMRYRLSDEGVTTIVQVNTTGTSGIDMTIRLIGPFTLTLPKVVPVSPSRTGPR